MKFRRIGIIFFVMVLFAIGMAGCSDFWSIDLDTPVQITANTTFLVMADGEDPLDARSQVEQILTKWKYRVTTAENANANTLYLLISYEYLPENQTCRYFTFVLRDAKGQDLKIGTYNGEKPLKDVLIDFDQFLGSSLFKLQ
jgi:hypothetical protein